MSNQSIPKKALFLCGIQPPKDFKGTREFEMLTSSESEAVSWVKENPNGYYHVKMVAPSRFARHGARGTL